jgi:class 3 adenylate cyclase
METHVSELAVFVVDESGAEVLVEVDEDSFGIDRASRNDDGIVKASGKVDDALASVMPAALRVLERVKDLSPKSTEVEFGIKLGVEAGAIIAKTSGEAHFTVKMTWEH